MSTAVLVSPNEAAQEQAVTQELEAATGGNHRQVQVGARTYTIQTLTAERFAALGALLLKEAQGALETQVALEGLVEEVRQSNWRTLAGQVAVTVVFWERLPGTFGRAMALLLSSEQPDDAAYLVAHLEPLTILDIVDGFMDTNRFEDLLERFFRLRDRWERAMRRLGRESD